jgi:cytochrome c oxidase assembly protein subunit 11
MHKPLLYKLLIIGVCMFAFSYALVPLYSVFCELTGLNGKTKNIAAASALTVDMQREITVEFLATVDQAIPWKFEPEITHIVVHPGEIKKINFRAENLTTAAMVGRAVPSVAPGQAAEHFKKMECFCFIEQPLGGKESKLMPLQFYIDPALPKEVKTVTLSYTLYKVTAQ